jgi:cyclopropane-fatty-acyl-phospholipid synthase
MTASNDVRANRRLDSFKRLLAHAHERVAPGFGFVLWDGSSVPAGWPADGLALVIADEGAVAGLLRRPNLDTVLNLWVSGRLDLRNGTLFDLVERRPKTRTREIKRTLDKRLILQALAKFLLVPRGGPWPLEELRRDKGRADGSAAAYKANISYHYDVSNAFYALFLDPDMVYSCAYFTNWNNDLATAQRDKLEMICRKLRLKPGERLLDMGCGWGGLTCYAAQHYGVDVHAVTLSEQQFAHVRDKVARLGLGSRVTVALADYQAIEGEFDKIAQIELFEHIGIDNHPTFFRKVYSLLKPGGLYLHHASTHPAKADDRRFRRKSDVYKAAVRYIFPGGEVDHIGMSVENLERYGFEIHDVEGWREHFARTCRHWHDRLFANRAAAEREVGREKTRMWLAFFLGCAVGFERGSIGLFQTVASRRPRGWSGLPPTRADLYR